QCLRLLKIGGVKALGELAVDRGQQQEHSVILTAHRKPFYNREKRDPSPIGKESRWAQHRLSRYPRSAQVASGRVFATNSTLALTSGWIGYKTSCPIRKAASPRCPRRGRSCVKSLPVA